MWTLSNIGPQKGAKKKRKRIGRGIGSGHGKTATKGHKGQLARSGGGKGPGFEGGQMPLYRRLPKKGFKNPFRVEYQVVNLNRLEERFENGDQVTPEVLEKKRLIRDAQKPVKILARGTLTKKLVVVADAASEAARKAIEAAGGTFQVRGSQESSPETKQEGAS